MTTDPFTTLGVEPRFGLDRKLLEERHRELSRALHPDRHAGSSAAQRREVLGKAIEVNDAFRLLKDPLRRAGALLRLRGLEEEEGAGEADPMLLMEMMEQREALAQARGERDAAALDRLAGAMRDREQAILSQLEEVLDRPGDDPQAAQQAAGKALGELRYVRRFLEEVATVEDELL